MVHPKDSQYPPTLSRTYDGSTNVDLTAEIALAPWAACQVLVSNTAASAGNLVVRLAGEPTTDVAIVIPAGLCVPIRGAFTAIRSDTSVDISATFFWQGGA